LTHVSAIAVPTKEDQPETSAGLSRPVVLIWAAVILAVSALANSADAISPPSQPDIATGLASVGVFQFLGWYAVFRLLTASDRSRPARWTDVMACLLLCTIVLLPSHRSTWIAATGLAGCLIIRSQADRNLRSAGIVLAALSVQAFWGPILFGLLSFPILNVETEVVAAILNITGVGATWHQNIVTVPGGHAILILSGCSSFHNISLGLLIWLTLSRLRGQSWTPRRIFTGLVIAACVVICNSARLYMMALSAEQFTYWHDGPGASIFAVGVSLLVLILSLIATRGEATLA